MRCLFAVFLLCFLPAATLGRDIELRLPSGRGLLYLPALAPATLAPTKLAPATLAPTKPAPMPLVLLLHGSSQTIASMRLITDGHWEALADRHGFALLYGEGLRGLWNIDAGPAPARLLLRRDDHAFLQALTARAARHTLIDAKQIYAVGFSMGGQMVMGLACDQPHLFKGIASVAHPLPRALVHDCARGPPIPLMLIHGARDPLVPIDGGVIPSGIDAGLDVMSLEETRALFAARNGDLAPVYARALPAHGHTWPGGARDFPALYLGPLRTDLNGAAMIWEFFTTLK